MLHQYISSDLKIFLMEETEVIEMKEYKTGMIFTFLFVFCLELFICRTTEEYRFKDDISY